MGKLITFWQAKKNTEALKRYIDTKSIGGANVTLDEIRNLLDSKEWIYDSDTKVAEYSYVYRNGPAPLKILGLKSAEIETNENTVAIGESAIDSETAITICSGESEYGFSLESSAIIAAVGENINVSVNGNSTLTFNDHITRIYNSAESTTVIYGTSNNEIITNAESNVLIYGKAGNDTISNIGSNVTINAGAGNDIISLNGGNGNLIIADEGNDTIYGYNSATCQIQAECRRTAANGDDAVIITSAGTLTIINGKNKAAVLNGEEVTISSVCKVNNNLEYFSLQDAMEIDTNTECTVRFLKNITEDFTLNDKSVTFEVNGYSYAGNITLTGGSLTIGNENLEVSSGTVIATYSDGFTNIVGSDEADYITSRSDNTTIIGRGGSDFISSVGDNVLIVGGRSL